MNLRLQSLPASGASYCTPHLCRVPPCLPAREPVEATPSLPSPRPARGQADAAAKAAAKPAAKRPARPSRGQARGQARGRPATKPTPKAAQSSDDDSDDSALGSEGSIDESSDESDNDSTISIAQSSSSSVRSARGDLVHFARTLGKVMKELLAEQSVRHGQFAAELEVVKQQRKQLENTVATMSTQLVSLSDSIAALEQRLHESNTHSANLAEHVARL